MTGAPPDDEALPEAALEALARALPERINADPDKVEQCLARLVLISSSCFARCSSIRPFGEWTVAPCPRPRSAAWPGALLKLSAMEQLKETST